MRSSLQEQVERNFLIQFSFVPLSREIFAKGIISSLIVSIYISNERKHTWKQSFIVYSIALLILSQFFSRYWRQTISKLCVDYDTNDFRPVTAKLHFRPMLLVQISPYLSPSKRAASASKDPHG
jgi:hypothetical protein